VITKKEEFIFMWKTLTMRMYLFQKYDRTIEFIDGLPNRFHSSVLRSQLGEGLLILGEFNHAQAIIDSLKKDNAFFEEDYPNSNSVISMLELKNSILLKPEEAIQHAESNLTTINNVINALGYREANKHIALSLYRKCKFDLFDLNNESINTISLLLGREGAVDEFITEYRKHKRKRSNNLVLGGYNWEDEAAMHFTRGLKEGSDAQFLKIFERLLDFLTGRENLGVMYLINSELTRTRLLFYLEAKLVESKEIIKARSIQSYIYFSLIKRNLNDVSDEVLRRHLDLNYRNETLSRPLNGELNKFLTASTIDWDQEFHLAKIAEELLDQSSDTRSFTLLKASNPNKWKIRKIKASMEWQRITTKFLRSFLSKGQTDLAMELAAFTVQPSETLHKIAMEIIIEDESAK
jgi:hypothetical protein